MSEAKHESVYKVVLSSGKEVLLREMKIKYQRLAMKACSSAGDNKGLLATMMQDELLKLLIVSVDGKKMAGAMLEGLDDIFTYPEYLQVVSVIGQVAGVGDDLGNVKVEIVNTSSNSHGSAGTQV